MRYSIKPMVIADYNEVVALWRDADGVGLNESDTRSAIASYLQRNPRMSFVARDGKKLVGAVLCGHDGRRGYLHHLAVAASHRRKGLGTQLVAKSLAGLKRLQIQKCNIFLFTDNADGECFWTRTGWKKRLDLCLVQTNLVASKAARCC